MPQFRKKPVVIEAVQLLPGDCRRGWRREVYDAHLWIDEAFEADVLFWCAKKGDDGLEDHHLKINTLEGQMRANDGDWLIRGVTGEIYACKPDIFEATYEPVPTLDGVEQRGSTSTPGAQAEGRSPGLNHDPIEGGERG